MKYAGVLIIAAFLALGCTKPDAHPEMKDKIYLDLVRQAMTSAKDLQTAEGELLTAEEKLNNIEPRTGQHARFWQDYYKAEEKLEKAKQELRYRELRAKSRRRMVREQYLRAYKAGQSWPQTNKHPQFVNHQRMLQTPRHWKHSVHQRQARELASRKKAASKKAAH